MVFHSDTRKLVRSFVFEKQDIVIFSSLNDSDKHEISQSFKNMHLQFFKICTIWHYQCTLFLVTVYIRIKLGADFHNYL